MSLPTDPVPTYQDAPSVATPLDSANLNEDSTAIVQLQTYVAGLQVDIPVTGVQTASSVTASANTYVRISTASNAVTVDLPTAPANFTIVGVKQVTRGGSNTVTAQLGGSDKFDTTTGGTTSTLTLQGQSAIWQYNSSDAVWVKISDDLPLSQLDLRYIGGLFSGDSSIAITGTASNANLEVNQPDLTLAQSQITGLPTVLNPTYSAGSSWGPNTYGTQIENIERDDVTGSLIMATGFKTWLLLLGLCPASTYSSLKLYLTAVGTSSTLTAALYGASSLTSTSWSRLGSGNVTPALTTLGIVSTPLAFTLSSPSYVALEMVLTTASTFPTFAGTPVSTLLGTPANFINPPSGSCPVFGQLNSATAPGTTLNPTTGFTNIAQKIWCALA